MEYYISIIYNSLSCMCIFEIIKCIFDTDATNSNNEYYLH